VSCDFLTFVDSENVCDLDLIERQVLI